MVKSGEEEKIKRILTDSKLSAIKAMLEKDYAIDCIFRIWIGVSGRKQRISCALACC
jgi:hypothetical protein